MIKIIIINVCQVRDPLVRVTETHHGKQKLKDINHMVIMIMTTNGHNEAHHLINSL